MAGQILPGRHLGKAGLAQDGLHRVRLLPAMFNQQPAIWQKMGGRTGGQLADGAQAIGKVGQRAGWLKAQIPLLQVRVIRSNIGGIGHQQGKALAGYGSKLIG